MDEIKLLILTDIFDNKDGDGYCSLWQIESNFNKIEKKSLHEILCGLESDEFLQGWGTPNPMGLYDVYRLTPKGKRFLKNYDHQEAQISISHVSNSNIAINSKAIIQKLNITDEDIKEKLIELEKAIEKKNPSLIKKAFGYIADKSVDVAIALLTCQTLK